MIYEGKKQQCISFPIDGTPTAFAWEGGLLTVARTSFTERIEVLFEAPALC